MNPYNSAPIVFDATYKLVTSPIAPPIVLGTIRLVLALYTAVTFIFVWIWSGVKSQEADGYLSYFTHLSYIGMCSYFCVAGFHTFVFARNNAKSYPLQKWWKGLQYLHLLLYSTIVTYPILVTVVYWALLASPASFGSPYASWSNISQHALNTVFALFEICLTNVAPMPWTHLLLCTLLLGCYLGVAYITHETLGFYAYSFLDPKKKGIMLVGYIIGIAVIQWVVFVAVRSAIVFRERVVQRYCARTADVEVNIGLIPINMQRKQ